MTYGRTSAWKRADYEDAREFELEVAAALGDWKRTEFESNDKLDIWVPGFYIEVKEKKQPLTKRWHLLPEVAGEDLFVLDELSVRRACRHWPEAFFVMRDCPSDRLFIMSITELVCVERTRVDRRVNERTLKGKWVIDLNDAHRLFNLEEVVPFVRTFLIDTPWKKSNCLGRKEVRSL